MFMITLVFLLGIWNFGLCQAETACDQALRKALALSF